MKDYLMKGGLRRHLLIVVENHYTGGFQAAVKLFKITEGECGNPLEVFCRKEGQRFTFLGGRPFGCLPQAIEEGRRIGIALVYLVPQARESSGFEVAAAQGGLPAASRSGYPDQWLLSHAVQLGKKPVSGK